MQCDNCTLCCELLDIPWMSSPSGKLCRECTAGVGCNIYDHAPKDCLSFNCAYSQAEKANIALRPDKCGVIWERVGSDVMHGVIESNNIRPKKIVADQISSFLNQKFSVAVAQKGSKLKIYPARGVSHQYVWIKIKERIEKNGCRNL